MKKYRLDTKETVIVDDRNPLGDGGGEGTVYTIASPSKYRSYCIKVYFPDKRAEKQKKIEYLINHRTVTSGSMYQICWPTNMVYDGNTFCGHMMPLAYPNSYNLLKIKPSNFDKKKNIPQALKDKYTRSTLDGLINRTKLCINIAIAIHEVHKTGKYVLVDLKPDNILFTFEGKISLVDFDSVQIKDGSIRFPSTVGTAEYVPPEQYIGTADVMKNVEWDYFSYAVLIYEILFGVHPFNGYFEGPYSHISDLADKIKKGLFVHGKNKKYLAALPAKHPHQMFDALWPSSVQQLFIQTFETGHNYPQQRVSIEKFAQTLYEQVLIVSKSHQSKKKLDANVSHFYQSDTYSEQKKATIAVSKYIWKILKWISTHTWRVPGRIYHKAMHYL